MAPEGPETKFIDTLQKNLSQHVMAVTRARGSHFPLTLDLVTSDENFIEDISYTATLGKSDQSVFCIKW